MFLQQRHLLSTISIERKIVILTGSLSQSPKEIVLEINMCVYFPFVCIKLFYENWCIVLQQVNI